MYSECQVLDRLQLLQFQMKSNVQSTQFKVADPGEGAAGARLFNSSHYCDMQICGSHRFEDWRRPTRNPGSATDF